MPESRVLQKKKERTMNKLDDMLKNLRIFMKEETDEYIVLEIPKNRIEYAMQAIALRLIGIASAYLFDMNKAWDFYRLTISKLPHKPCEGALK